MERYEMPGFVDFHLHMGWTDFDHADQDKRSEKDVKDRIAGCAGVMCTNCNIKT